MRRIERHSDRLEALGRELEVVSPLRILSRGYTVTTDGDGRLLRTRAEAIEAAELRTRFADGTVPSTPVKRADGEGAATAPASELPPLEARSAPKSLVKRRPRSGKKRESRDQMDLFGGGGPVE